LRVKRLRIELSCSRVMVFDDGNYSALLSYKELDH
jgi:hypothetical protein